MLRFTPGIVRLKQLVDGGEIGEIRRIEAGLAYAARYASDHPLFDPVSGGALLDLAQNDLIAHVDESVSNYRLLADYNRRAYMVDMFEERIKHFNAAFTQASAVDTSFPPNCSTISPPGMNSPNGTSLALSLTPATVGVPRGSKVTATALL